MRGADTGNLGYETCTCHIAVINVGHRSLTLSGDQGPSGIRAAVLRLVGNE